MMLPKEIVVAGSVTMVLLIACIGSIGVIQAQEGGGQQCGEPTTLPVQPEDAGRYRFQREVEPYYVRVDLIQSRLSIGTTVVAVYVWEESTCRPVPDATITLLTRHSDAQEEKKVTAVNLRDESDPARYHAQMTLDAPGDWQVTIEIAGDLGNAALEVPTLTVEEARQDLGGRLVFIAVSLVIIAGAAYLWWSTQRRRRRLESSDQPSGSPAPDDGPDSGSASP